MSKKMRIAIEEQAMSLDEGSLERLVEAAADADVVMIGEATHGTNEFYEIRAELTKRLIVKKGFTIVAVEGDWPAAEAVNRYVKGFGDGGTARDVLRDSFTRWPEWMWANEVVADFIEWLKSHNTCTNRKTGFYGIDMYSLYESIDELLSFLSKNPKYGADLELAKKAFSCFEPYNRLPDHYALSSAHFTDECISEVSTLLSSIQGNKGRYDGHHEENLNVVMNALVAKNAEAYYRELLQEDAISWNTRDLHMAEAIKELKNYHEDAKIIIWEHNTHIGDASATSMKDAGMTNVGQIMREQYGKHRTYAIGFGTYEGTVIASSSWGESFERMSIPPAKFNTWEGQLHGAKGGDKVLLFTYYTRELFSEWIGHRAIGVVYNPEFEAFGNFVPSRVGNRYDALIFHRPFNCANAPLNTSFLTKKC
ncbi:erythromycin esterase family protein [Sporosarcina sp. BI001-red]|uniref:erythromycin esterase family protein n=1 Tax=Sporosarcina sp. BI001-red TaxID=2282866 RepID=UPI000E243259|nr:erythromycin esterase family protein [Sporosarcina sp. BI001-red]REB11128.1 erythromycin esterase family protein [Sporosarcina sp. BI001-red]